MRLEEKKKQILIMRDNGMTYNEIGRRLGVSRQRVHQIATGRKSKPAVKGTSREAVKRIPYVGLREWMLANNVTMTELARWCGLRGIALNGNKKLRMATAEKILKVTGLEFEECFRRDDDVM